MAHLRELSSRRITSCGSRCCSLHGSEEAPSVREQQCCAREDRGAHLDCTACTRSFKLPQVACTKTGQRTGSAIAMPSSCCSRLSQNLVFGLSSNLLQVSSATAAALNAWLCVLDSTCLCFTALSTRGYKLVYEALQKLQVSHKAQNPQHSGLSGSRRQDQRGVCNKNRLLLVNGLQNDRECNYGQQSRPQHHSPVCTACRT